MELTRGQKISMAKKGKPNGRLGYKHAEETKKKISQSEKGKKVTLEQIEKNRVSHLGLKQSIEARMNLSKSLKKFWDKKGRKNKRPYHKIDMAYKNWRLAIFIRDNWTCQNCHKIGIYLEAHHIKSFAKYPELKTQLDNGIALCRECHKKTDNYKGKAKKNN